MQLARSLGALARHASPITKPSPCSSVNQLPRLSKRAMATVKDPLPHVERTANDPRQTGLYNANISRVELVNKRIRLIRLSLQKDGPPLRHLPGQYVDLHIPSVPVVGGFTIVSPPQTAILRPVDKSSNQPIPADEDKSEFPCVDLAIQVSDSNPPAAYLWRDPPSSILDAPVSIRIGGDFTYPPSTLSMQEFQKIDNVVFVAGGVGINPIMSMLSAMDLAGPSRLGGMVKRVRVLYASKREVGEDGEEQEVLFEDRLRRLATKYRDSREVDFRYTLFETGKSDSLTQREKQGNADYECVMGRIKHKDLLDAIGHGSARETSLVYVCGVPSMTDEFVGLLRSFDGLDEKRVLCEKWW